MNKQRLGSMAGDRLLHEAMQQRFDGFQIVRMKRYQPIVTDDTETWKFDLDGKHYRLVLNRYSGNVTFVK
jgi:hypothetical protein